MATQSARITVVKLESYEGDDTFIRCGDDQQDHMFIIVRIDADGSAEVMDCGYRTRDEAIKAWPEAESRGPIHRK